MVGGRRKKGKMIEKNESLRIQSTEEKKEANPKLCKVSYCIYYL